MTTLKQQLTEDWERYRNPAALRALLRALPLELPSAALRAERDARLRAMAAPLLARRYSTRRVAGILAELGNAAEAGRPPQLGTTEPELHLDIAAARRECQRMLSWMNVRACGRRWLSARAIFDIIVTL